MELRCGQVTLDVFDPSSIGQPFAPSPAGIALRVARRRRRARRARGEGRRVRRRHDRHRRLQAGLVQGSRRQRADAAPAVRRMTRADLLERYRALPLPTTKDESWRFTDLKGFDPESFSANGATEVVAAPALLELEAAGRRPRLRGRARDRPRARGDPLRAARRASAPRRARRLGREVRRAQRRRVGARPARPRPEGRRARAAAARADRQLGRGRLALLAAADRRRAGQPRLGDRGVRVDDARALRLPERRGRDLRRGRRQGRVRLGAERQPRDLALRQPPRADRARRRARLGRGRLRLEEGQDPDPERPRRPGRDLTRHRRLLRRRRPAPGLRHLPGAHRPEHDLGLRLQGRAARRVDARSGAG